ncbi:hypothetical protein [Streptomyces sp. NBC_00102]|uniref:hypothetical protein n=1 Tax=Streptomyces sp. NBC_00102 TaxID=2975652 RepID=UPI0022537370|nr:hypothetical protein [Streptomyces sp. NBC_00102]MCX5401014.1 hypothetical protein [Streptomyces sp. NBC_00102]
MTTYQGPASALIGCDEIPVTADLAVHVDRDSRSWGGHLEADPSVEWFDDGPATLRLPDGREGEFIATSGEAGSGTVEIRGSGPAPFGDK